MDKNKPIILGISAASGIIYGIKILEFFLLQNFSVELIISSKAYYIANQELGLEVSHSREIIKKNILKYLKINYSAENLKIWLDDEIWANPSSGSYITSGMIIAPASMSTVASIAHGYTENLISRIADVCIKEKRLLTIVPRETPLSSIHLENMLKLSNLGVNILPPILGFYGKIKTLEQGIEFVVGKILDVSGIKNDLYERWNI
jgi:4-hydroxy-3-polyprenylbenzoate decarboxylase